VASVAPTASVAPSATTSAKGRKFRTDL
jgi:hypothetical protein